MESVPLFAWLLGGACVVAVALEFFFWFELSPALMPSMVFRRRLGLGRKAYVGGNIRFGHDGSPELRWAPYPLVMYPALPAIMLPFLYLDQGEPLSPMGFGFAMVAAILIVGGINLFMGRWFLKRTLLPELQSQLESWLA